MTAPLDLHVSDRGTGLPVVFSHGVGDDTTGWEGAASVLADRYRIVLWDQPGHGQSPKLTDESAYGARVAYEGLCQVADPFERVVLVGHSLGGYLSTRYTIDHPAKVAALVLVATGPGFRSAEAMQKWNDEQHRSAAKRGRPETLVGLHEDSYVMDHITEISCPSLVIVGSEDVAFLGASDYFQKKVAGLERVTIEGAGHTVPQTHAAEVGGLIADFLDRHGIA